MATPPRAITAPPPKTPTAASTTPGTWTHPLTPEVRRRQARTSFTDKSARQVAWNAAALVATFGVPFVVFKVHLTASFLNLWPELAHTCFYYTLNGARLLFLYNILDLAFAPLLLQKDECTDLPLTPDQRRFLGLTPDTPLSAEAKSKEFVTPPRYAPSPRTSFSKLHVIGDDSPRFYRSPQNATSAQSSPSIDTPRPRKLFATSSGSPMRGSPPTPIPSANTPMKGVVNQNTVTPNNRWLYEKQYWQKASRGSGSAEARFSPARSLSFSPAR